MARVSTESLTAVLVPWASAHGDRLSAWNCADAWACFRLGEIDYAARAASVPRRFAVEIAEVRYLARAGPLELANLPGERCVRRAEG